MSSRHLVDPVLLPVLDVLPHFRLDADTLEAQRAIRMALAAEPPVPDDSDVSIEERTIPGPDGHDLRLVILRPATAAEPRPALLHIHGGGYVMGSADMMMANNMAIVRSVDCVVVSVDYRLAPETPFPGALEDCHAALRWLHDEADALGVDPERLAVAGESAGGGLAAGLVLLARDRGEVPLIFQHLIYPMIDDRTCGRATPPFAGEFVWTPEANVFGWSSYLGQPPGGDAVSAYAAAARADDLAGLPPTFLSVGALDLFLDENLDYVRRLIHAGVPTECHVYPGAFHGFQLQPETRLAKAAACDSRQALRRALHPG